MKDYSSEVKMLDAGEYGLVVEFEAVISPRINALVQQLTQLIVHKTIDGIIEVVPTYKSVTVYFNPLVVTRECLLYFIKQLLAEIKPQDMDQLTPKIVHVPVCYGGVFGPDLEFVARYTGLSSREVTAIHTSMPYLVYMLGFTPGFPYLGGMSERIAVPRQEKPRSKIPAGSVGIGGNQTGFYPIESPGEWWLIGRTRIKAFHPSNTNPFLFAAGDYLHFVDITMEQYFIIRREVETGKYVPEISYMR